MSYEPPTLDPQFNHLMLDLRERMVAIEVKLDALTTVQVTAYEALATAKRNREDISELKTYATENRQNAIHARNIAEQDAADIQELKETNRWNQRFMMGLIFGIIVNLTLNVLQSI